MRFCRRGSVLLFAFAVLVISSGRSFAQTDPDLLIKPWQDGQMFDTSTQAVLEAANPTKEDHNDNVQMSIYHAEGRWRVLPNLDATPRFGYDITYVDLETHDHALPRHLFAGTVGFAQPVAQISNWFVVVTGAAGYAGESPFSDPHAAFFTGNLIVGRKFSDDKAIVVALNYDGNRAWAPDVPIPAIEFANRFNEHLTYLIGFPYNSLIYEPTNGLQIVAGWEPASTFSARIGWEFLKHYEVYTSYTDRLTAYHLSDLPEDRRLFLQEHRLEAGLRINPTKLIRLSIGGGWAFGQEFSTGFDERGTTPLRHLRDGPFGEALVEIGL